MAAAPPRVRAFTLVELLVVVSIIALLIAILLPSLRRAREQAKMVQCLAHMRGTAQAAIVFAGNHNDRIQVATDEFGLSLADPDRNKYAYDAEGELLTWPVALAQAAGISYRANWDWGVRAANYSAARNKEDLMTEDLEFVLCPSDRIKLATTRYPWRAQLRGAGDPDDPSGSATGGDTSYWGFLSYAINEDIAGVEVDRSVMGNIVNPGCWHTVNNGSGWTVCRGETFYSPRTGCANTGHRLRGLLERVHRPGDVGLVFEAGSDNEVANSSSAWANLITSAQAEGPFLGDSLHSSVGQGRVPLKRHLDGRLSVLFADMHGDTVIPTEFDEEDGQPTKFSPRVRVSPYPLKGYVEE